MSRFNSDRDCRTSVVAVPFPNTVAELSDMFRLGLRGMMLAILKYCIVELIVTGNVTDGFGCVLFSNDLVGLHFAVPHCKTFRFTNKCIEANLNK
jgi:hypothetical protein